LPTHIKGLKDLQGTHDKFCTTLCNGGQFSYVWLATWDANVPLQAINQLVSDFGCQNILH